MWIWLLLIYKSLLAGGPALEISGNITESVYGKPVDKAYIYTVAGEEETLSNSSGRFRLLTWQKTPVKVRFEKKGFKSREIIYTANSINHTVILSPE
ncbi:MAG: hypothetical protein QM687_10035 [Ferruginibacter sp.]